MRKETVQTVEELAYEKWKEILNTAYEKDGLLGVVQISAHLATMYDKAASASEEDTENIEELRAALAAYLAMEAIPETLEEIKKL